MFDLPIITETITPKQRFMRLKREMEQRFPGEYNFKRSMWTIPKLLPNEENTIVINFNIKQKLPKFRTKVINAKSRVTDIIITAKHSNLKGGDVGGTMSVTLTAKNVSMEIKNHIIITHDMKRSYFEYESNSGKNVHTKMIEYGQEKQFYVVDSNGHRIIPANFYMNSDNVMDAWKTALRYVKSDIQVKRNDTVFSVHKSDGGLMTNIVTQS